MDTNDVGKKFFILTVDDGWVEMECTRHRVDHRVLESCNKDDNATVAIYHLDWADHVLLGHIKGSMEVLV